MKDKVSRESKGVAFILFLDRDSAQKAVTAINQKQVLILNFWHDSLLFHLLYFLFKSSLIIGI